MPRPKVLKSGDISEAIIQKTVMEMVRLNKRLSPFVFHIPNEGKRSKHFGGVLKDMGMRAGVSDLFIAIPNRGYHGAWIELKSAKGILTKAQKLFLEDMDQQHYFTAICRSIDEAINTIIWYTDFI